MRANSAVLYTLALSCIFVSCNKPQSLFINLPSSKTNVTFANNLEKKDLLSILYYLYYYNGGGVAIGDINNDGLPDIYFTANSTGHNKLYLNKGNFQFEDITDKAGVAGTADWCTGATFADVNGDGLLDIYVCAVANTHGLKGRNELFINNGNGHFTESAAKYGLDFSGFSTQAVFFDFDHDGDLDCFILNQSHLANQNITDTANRRKFDPNAGDRLYRNDQADGKQKFTDISAHAGIYQSSLGYGLGIAVADFNNDGWDDIYIGNDFHENDYYYINNHDGTFTESGAEHFKHYSRFSMGNDAADYNNDGQLDIVTVDMLPGDEKTLKTYGSDEHFDIYNQKITANGYQHQVSRNCLQRNNGDGISFSDVALMGGISATDWSWCPLFADFDNDGNKDLFISSGIVKRPVDMDYIRFKSNPAVHKALNSTDKFDDDALSKMPDGASHPFFFKGDGQSGFRDISSACGTASFKGFYNGAAYADLDNDGRIDMVINCLNAPAMILKNNSDKKNYLSLSCKGKGMNTDGIGTKVYVFSSGKMQFEELMRTRGFMSASDAILHFGLDSMKSVDSLLIIWPDQSYQLIRNVAVNKILTIKQADARGVFDHDRFFPQAKPVLQDVTQQIDLRWKHREDPFVDFNVQYLIPHMESTRGPKIAVADVNGDGLEDFFVTGAIGQAGALMLQTRSGNFIHGDSAVFVANKATEGVDAIFFDANHDGFADLYVVSGGNEYDDGNAMLADHLYFNDGKGHFKEHDGAIPAILKNKTCVSVADINHDGYLDIFVGGFADSKSYGFAQPSYLLINDGKGNFSRAPDTIISLENVGMITTSVFADINNDGWPDLVVAGEWTPVQVFINDHGKFRSSAIPNSSGLWQRLTVADVNGDGKPDLLGGNWGLNSKLSSGKNGPLKLYVKDFDKNGSVDQVMAYTVDGQEYPFLAKDELEMQMPVLKKAYLTYSEVAGKTVQYLFFDLFKDYKELSVETLASYAFINDGKGNFTKQELPKNLQMAPMFAFSAVTDSKTTEWIGAGNFYGVLPYEGRYDASSPEVFSYDSGTERFCSRNSLPNVDGEVRDIKWIHGSGNNKILILARNNKEIIFLKMTNE